MPLIKGGEIVSDSWQRLDDGSPLPEGGEIIVSFDRLRERFEDIKNYSGRIGVEIANDIEVRDLEPYLSHLGLIALHFPAFVDGRAYSQAWQLRQKMNFKGEIRATGDVLADQAVFMVRSGIDAFEVAGNQPIETWQKAMAAMTHAYQRGYGEKAKSIRRAVVI